MGVATGCGCKEVYRFPHTTYPYSSCICSFLQQLPTFCSFLKMFFVLVPVLFVITFYVLNNFFTQYKHIPATTGFPRQPYEAAHTVLYMNKHTQTYASYPAMYIRSRSRGRALYRDASRAGRLRTGPASFKGQRSRTRRRSQCMPRRLR